MLSSYNMIKANTKLLLQEPTKEKKQRIVADYNDIAKEYDRDFSTDTSDNKYIDIFLDSLDGLRVLDAGCGCGRDYKYMVQKGFSVDGIDLSSGMLKIAQEKLPNGKFELMDMTDLTYPDDKYDGILCNHSFFHIPVKEIPKTLLNFKRVLKNNGNLLLILNEGDGETMIEEPYRPETYLYMNYFSMEQIKGLLQKYEFKIISATRVKCTDDLSDYKLIILSNNQK